MELESENSLPFLDILCTRLDNHIDLSIYHKPTSTDSIIQSFAVSCCPAIHQH